MATWYNFFFTSDLWFQGSSSLLGAVHEEKRVPGSKVRVKHAGRPAEWLMWEHRGVEPSALHHERKLACALPHWAERWPVLSGASPPHFRTHRPFPLPKCPSILPVCPADANQLWQPLPHYKKREVAKPSPLFRFTWPALLLFLSIYLQPFPPYPLSSLHPLRLACRRVTLRRLLFSYLSALQGVFAATQLGPNYQLTPNQRCWLDSFHVPISRKLMCLHLIVSLLSFAIVEKASGKSTQKKKNPTDDPKMKKNCSCQPREIGISTVADWLLCP